MSVIIDATVAGANANSYATEAEVDSYFLARLPLSPPWTDAADPTAAMVMATRTLDSYAMPHKKITIIGGKPYYVTTRTWTGAPATSTQALAWPRSGMKDSNGNPIPTNVIPKELKAAEAELAGQLVVSDTTLNSDVITQGLTSVRAGSVALTFKDYIPTMVIPDAVWMLMPASWFTEEIIQLTGSGLAQFDVVSDL